MTAVELEHYLHAEIPLTVPMGLRVTALDRSSLTLEAPLAPNRNDKHTAFGGSIAAMLLLAGWGRLHAALLDAGRRADIMIHRSAITFDAPVEGVLSASCVLPGDDAWSGFLGQLASRGRGRVGLEARLAGRNGAAASLDGSYFARLRQ